VLAQQVEALSSNSSTTHNFFDVQSKTEEQERMHTQPNIDCIVESGGHAQSALRLR
jgi:hypothetical protein